MGEVDDDGPRDRGLEDLVDDDDGDLEGEPVRGDTQPPIIERRDGENAPATTTGS